MRAGGGAVAVVEVIGKAFRRRKKRVRG